MSAANEEARLAEVCGKLFLLLTTFRRNSKKVDIELQWFRQKLMDVFSEIEAEVRQRPELAADYDQAKFAMVAFADEVALHTEWDGQDDWEIHLLEQQYFGTAIAGEEFYARQKLVPADNSAVNEVYYICMALGFKGKLRSRPEEAREITNRLFSLIPSCIAKKNDLLSPEAYEQNVEKDMTRLPVIYAARVAVVLVALVLLTALASRQWTENNIHELVELADKNSAHVEEEK